MASAAVAADAASAMSTEPTTGETAAPAEEAGVLPAAETHSPPEVEHASVDSGGPDAENEEDGELDAPEALALAMEDALVERADYYALCARVAPHYWGFEYICPKPPPFRSSCLVPTIGGVGVIGARLAALGAEVVVSIGSGAGLLEWLLAARFDAVVCVDVFYRPTASGLVDEWVVPPLRPTVADSWHSEGVAPRPMSFVHPEDASRSLPAILGGRSAALLLCWPQLSREQVAAYAAWCGGVGGVRGLVMVAGENCSPKDPADAGEAAGCGRDALVGDGEDVKCLSEPCSLWTFLAASVGVPSDLDTA